MVNFKTRSGVTISVPGSLKDPKVEQAIRDLDMNDLKTQFDEAMKKMMPNRNPKSLKLKKRGGVIRKAKVGMQMKGTSRIIKKRK